MGEIQESIAAAEKQLGKKMPTPHRVEAAAFAPVKYDVEGQLVQLNDFSFDPDEEDRDVMASLASAEKEMGKTMKTPQKVKQESFKPVKYDVEDGALIQVKDDDLFDDGSEDR